MQMNSTRLFALSALARGGPAHGYQIRRAAKLDRTELWTDVKPGSLYNALHRMQAEGLVTVVRTERDGNPPERTVYAITAHGRQELIAHRDAALCDVRLHPDAVDLALQYTPDLAEEDLAAAISARREGIAARLLMLEHEFQTAEPYLVGIEPMTFQHSLIRLRAELAWHDQLLEQLPKLLAHDVRHLSTHIGPVSP
jgi:DNA-binding PadR family transcriptional regulator